MKLNSNLFATFIGLAVQQQTQCNSPAWLIRKNINCNFTDDNDNAK